MATQCSGARAVYEYVSSEQLAGFDKYQVSYYHSYSGWQDIVSTSLSMYHASDILAARVWSWPVGVK